jgi:hypothetical protein
MLAVLGLFLWSPPDGTVLVAADHPLEPQT